MEKCVRCGVELEGGDDIKTCPKCGTCYTKDEKGNWIHSNAEPDECVYK
jgi:hypothetical protein